MQTDMQPDRSIFRQKHRCTACRTGIHADISTDKQIGCQVARWIARQTDVQMGKLNSKQAELQNRWISRQIDAQPDMQIGMQQNRHSCRYIHRQADWLPDCQMDSQIARYADRHAAEQAGRQQNRQIGRTEMHEQQDRHQEKLNPICEFSGPASKVLNAVSAENSWHRQAFGNIGRLAPASARLCC
jgi:hypothetical protein